jgi:APA family basic amino acid/polyamine antiporter
LQREFFVRKASGLVRQVSAKDALIFNIMNSAPMFPFVFIIYTGLLYPGADLVLATLIAIPLTMIIAVAYYLFAVTMPRSGGDYVWVSRSVHPAIGFGESFLFTAILISYVGPLGSWPVDPGLKSILFNWGTITNNAAMVAQASGLATTNNLFICSLIITVIVCGLNFFSTKTLWKFYWGFFVLSVFGVLVFWAVMLSAGHAAFVTRFNQISGANYDAVIQAGKSIGYDTTVTLATTLVGSVFVFLNLLGYQWATYVGGEVKDVPRSQMVAIIGQVLVCGAWMLTTYVVTYNVVGYEFINSASYLAQTGSAAWTVPTLPSLPYMVLYATSNPWLAIIPAIGLIANVIATLTTLITMATRVFFAWAFDRIVPTRLAQIDDRFHAPRNALIVIFIIGIIYVVLNYYTSVLSYWAYGNLGSFLPITIVCIAIAALPYRRKDILEKAPKIAQTRVGNIPLMTILGLAAALINGFIAVFSVAPVFTGAPINPIYVSAIFLTMVVGIVIYGIAYWYNRRIGIDMHLGFTEIPPA